MNTYGQTRILKQIIIQGAPAANYGRGGPGGGPSRGSWRGPWRGGGRGRGGAGGRGAGGGYGGGPGGGGGSGGRGRNHWLSKQSRFKKRSTNKSTPPELRRSLSPIAISASPSPHHDALTETSYENCKTPPPANHHDDEDNNNDNKKTDETCKTSGPSNQHDEEDNNNENKNSVEHKQHMGSLQLAKLRDEENYRYNVARQDRIRQKLEEQMARRQVVEKKTPHNNIENVETKAKEKLNKKKKEVIVRSSMSSEKNLIAKDGINKKKKDIPPLNEICLNLRTHEKKFSGIKKNKETSPFKEGMESKGVKTKLYTPRVFRRSRPKHEEFKETQSVTNLSEQIRLKFQKKKVD